MQLFELCGQDKKLSFSPFVWRTKMALAHKALEHDIVYCHFTEKEPFAHSGSKTVPVIDDGGTWVSDSWKIACYLEDTYTDSPSLFGSEEGRALAYFMNEWAARHLVLGMFTIIAPDIPQHLTPADETYFRRSRKMFFGHDIDELIPQREDNIKRFKSGLGPLRSTLKAQEFISGSKPAYGDYIVFGAYQWVRLASEIDLLEGEKYIAPWFEKMLDMYDGLGRNAPSGF